MQVNGQIISGEFDESANQFVLQQIKHSQTESALTEKQLNTLCDYLNKHRDEPEGQIVTLYDQLLVPLSQEEVVQLLSELEELRGMYR
ncbi:hypothetical protein MM300_18665 [Evansella sp. LMS18]|jgi:hypothetical protein|uniref:hypothetical protein n=1 Tax=Evansella sp. LMS18 TaxID=2924033 RepID=UPI0020D13ACC|nr:hypothetical protein [Evansella sp. LMS18]UTR09885.1 hypothetical protein MM300_18665 [Evansella sp. LMS18]